jgi:hypothetical protein
MTKTWFSEIFQIGQWTHVLLWSNYGYHEWNLGGLPQRLCREQSELAPLAISSLWSHLATVESVVASCPEIKFSGLSFTKPPHANSWLEKELACHPVVGLTVDAHMVFECIYYNMDNSDTLQHCLATMLQDQSDNYCRWSHINVLQFKKYQSFSHKAMVRWLFLWCHWLLPVGVGQEELSNFEDIIFCLLWNRPRLFHFLLGIEQIDGLDWRFHNLYWHRIPWANQKSLDHQRLGMSLLVSWLKVVLRLKTLSWWKQICHHHATGKNQGRIKGPSPSPTWYDKDFIWNHSLRKARSSVFSISRKAPVKLQALQSLIYKARSSCLVLWMTPFSKSRKTCLKHTGSCFLLLLKIRKHYESGSKPTELSDEDQILALLKFGEGQREQTKVSYVLPTLCQVEVATSCVGSIVRDGSQYFLYFFIFAPLRERAMSKCIHSWSHGGFKDPAAPAKFQAKTCKLLACPAKACSQQSSLSSSCRDLSSL